jgi:type IX secretion system PorP/SprF family membrane protein
MKKIVLAFALFAWASIGVQAQQLPRYSQYMFNQLTFNPAYTGTTEGLSITALGRMQWVNIKGAPTTVSLAAHSPLGVDKKAGVGGFLEYDEIGVHRRSNLFLSYAYKFILGESRFSIGLNGGITMLQSNYTQATGNELINLGIDPAFAQDESRLMPNFGLGIYWYRPNRFYVGLSAPQLLENRLTANGGTDLEKVAHQYRHYMATAGLIIGRSDFRVRPSILVKAVPTNAPIQTDASLMFLIKDTFWFGGSYRSAFGGDKSFESESVDAIIAFQLKNGLKIGYAYDFTLSELNNYTSGSHEIMLGYDFRGKGVRYHTPRYF